MRTIASLCLISLAAIECAGQEIYVAGFAARRINKLSPDGTVMKSILMSESPFDLVATRDGEFLYASHPAAAVVSVIRTAGDAVTGTIPAAFAPAKMAIGNNDTRLYIANNSTAAPHVTIVDIRPERGGRRAVVTGGIDLKPLGAHSAYAVSALGSWLAVGTQTGHLLLYDTGHDRVTLLAVRSLGARIMHVEFSPLGTKLYAFLATPAPGFPERGTTTSGNVHVLRTPTLDLKTVIAAGESQLKAAHTVDGNHLYVTDVRGRVHVIDIGTDLVEATVRVGRQLAGIQSAGKKIFVADPAADVVYTFAANGHHAPDQPTGTINIARRFVPIALAVVRHPAPAADNRSRDRGQSRVIVTAKR